MHRAIILGLLATVWSASTTHAQATDLQAKAYMTAIRCYVANNVSAGDQRFNPGGVKDARYHSMAEQSYNSAVKLGRMLGKSDARVQEDFASSQSFLPGAFKRDDSFFKRVRGECLDVGLM